MSNQNSDIDNSIDSAIDTCTKNINVHRKEGRVFFTIIIITLVVFVLVQGLAFYSNAYNQNKVSGFKDELIFNSKKIEQNVSNNIALFSELTSFNKKHNNDSVYGSFNNLLDSLALHRSNIDTITSDLRKLPTLLNSSFLKIDNTVIYIFYGVFILVFGILTSFYKFHLKEAAKYEHFLFGFLRIRIAGNNSKTRYEDEVKTSLTKDAFSIEHKPLISKDKGIESPIPGHPTSDAFIFIMNKILGSVEITAKPKNKKESTDTDDL